jgi:GTPase SAR1 family protein
MAALAPTDMSALAQQQTAKLVLLGEQAAGKSSLVLRYVKGQFFDYQVGRRTRGAGAGGGPPWAGRGARAPRLAPTAPRGPPRARRPPPWALPS